MSRKRSPDPALAKIEPYTGPAGGWGSLQGLSKVSLDAEVAPDVALQLARQNKQDGFMCVSCAFGKPEPSHPAEFCENGAKATAWELTRRRATPAFFAEHTVSELKTWTDYELEQAGRITHPLRYDHGSDRYVPCGWEEAFAGVAAALRPLDPTKVVFYASGRASLETSYMWALMARMYGSQNLPDSSNMCHESTSVGLKQAVGSPVGTCRMDEFEKTDCILFFGQNTGVNSPRFLHDLQRAAKRGVPIITFNPLKERGLERFTNPQNPFEMATGAETQISREYHQVKAGGDIAAITGLCKHVIDLDDAARAAGAPPVLDHAFIADYTAGFAAFADFCRRTGWDEIEHHSGLTRAALVGVAETYAKAKATMVVYGMGLTQHVLGVQNVHMVCALLLLRGNIGRPGAGPAPVRGHSNVQGQRTVGISEKPELVPLDKLAEQFGFEPPREKGLNTVETCAGILKGEVQGFVSLGGNFARAAPDQDLLWPAWERMAVTVQIATKLNRSHLLCGKAAYLLPCLGRIEQDVQATGPQRVTMEDSYSQIHPSFATYPPASEHLLSEPAIVAGVAKALLPPNPKVDWDRWVGDYATVRDAIAETYPNYFSDFNARLEERGGFWRGNKSANRDFSEAEGGKANFFVPSALSATGFEEAEGRLRLVTLRSNDQFNTTVYGYDDRFRGIHGTREVLLMNPVDMARHKVREGQVVSLEGDAGDGQRRVKGGLRVTAYDIPEGCVGGYYPECNVLIPVAHHAQESGVPAAKSVPVRLVA